MKRNWKTEALKNDELVAEQLLSLKRSSWIHSPPESLLKPLRWGIRGRRSGLPLPPLPPPAAAARISPNTPLSWSGGSDGAIKQPYCRSHKSKCVVASEKPKETTDNKWIEKQRMDRLREREIKLKKEKTLLKKDLVSVRDVMKKEKRRSDELNNYKFLYDGKTASESRALFFYQGKEIGGSSLSRQGVSTATGRKHGKRNDIVLAPAPPSYAPAAQNYGIHFTIPLPDLNTVPIEYEQAPRGVNKSIW